MVVDVVNGVGVALGPTGIAARTSGDSELRGEPVFFGVFSAGDGLFFFFFAGVGDFFFDPAFFLRGEAFGLGVGDLRGWARGVGVGVDFALFVDFRLADLPLLLGVGDGVAD